jgi:hypothetical protein
MNQKESTRLLEWQRRIAVNGFLHTYAAIVEEDRYVGVNLEPNRSLGVDRPEGTTRKMFSLSSAISSCLGC